MNISSKIMASPWTYSSLCFPLLVLLYGVIAEETPPGQPAQQNPPQPDGQQPPTDNSIINITNGSSGIHTSQSDNVTRPIQQTTTADITTMDILSIMSERDSLHEESERLKAAVIVLAIFFTLAVVAIVIGLVWFFIIRRKSKLLNTENRSQTTSAEQKRETQPKSLTNSQNMEISANKNAKEKTDKVVKQQAKELRNSNSISASGTSGDYEDQGKPPDKAKLKNSPIVPKNVFYTNTVVNQAESSDGQDLDEREVYIELDNGNKNSEVADAGTTNSVGSDQLSLNDEIYENYTKEAGGNYSELDSETQYDHHYD